MARRPSTCLPPKSETPPLESLVFSRLAFGPRPADVDTFRGMGATPRERLENWLEVQLDPETIADDEFDTRLSQSNYLTLEKDLFDLWNDHAREEEDFDYHMLPIYETQHAAILRAIYSRRQLTEVLADFWHNHFNVYRLPQLRRARLRALRPRCDPHPHARQLPRVPRGG